MTDDVTRITEHMRRKANAGKYNQPDAVERLTKRAIDGDIDAENTLKRVHGVHVRPIVHQGDSAP